MTDRKRVRRKLKAWFIARSHDPGRVLHAALDKYRYLPRAYSADGSGWGVWDRIEKRYLSDAEVLRMNVEHLWHTTAVEP